MTLKQIIQGGFSGPVAHKDWPIGEHIFKRSERWLKMHHDPRSIMEVFDINKADHEDDGYFMLPSQRPTYSELIALICPSEQQTEKGQTISTKKVFFIQETVKEDGEYVVCIAEEGTRGYSKTNWLWGTDKELAQELCDQRNEEAGISKDEALKIIISTMRKE